MNAQRKATISEFGKAVARHLNARRAHQEITQMELAEATGISQSQLSKQLRYQRDINLDELAAICRALNVPMMEIVALAESDIAGHNVVPIRRSNKSDSGVEGAPYSAVADSSPDEDALRADEEGDAY